ncbi:hypothetical protein M0813_02318 [Anaeramoeba flamelloides]|uniref:Uncharacterized protein n=1 Tax=Anaeramoeba flamelloides TaxID=1746091 RepID=A0ABQ8YIF0_9EUKA|nr:hypothetical protein M0813_02318 [Anaeramoeba flamelloides]
MVFFEENSTSITQNIGSHQTSNNDLINEIRKKEKNQQNSLALQKTKTTHMDTPPKNDEGENSPFHNHNISLDQKPPLNPKENSSPILKKLNNPGKEKSLNKQVLKTPLFHQFKNNTTISPRYPLSTHTPSNDIIVIFLKKKY